MTAVEITSLSLTAVGLAFAAGLVSFASPCVLPLLPVYLSFISGVGVGDLGARRRRLLLPSLRRDEGFFARALRLGRARVPEWLARRRADAILEIGAFTLGDLRLEGLTAHARWDAANLEITELGARFGAGVISGRLLANLRRAAPAYRLSARFRAVNWMGGQWDGRTRLETSGVGPDLLRNLRLEGAFDGRSVSLAGDTEIKSVSGSYVLTLPDGLPRFRFSNLQARVGEDLFEGQGSTGEDGRLYFELSDGQKQMRVSGTLSPFQLELAAARNPG